MRRACRCRSAPSSPACCWPTASSAMSWKRTSSRSRDCCSGCSSSPWACRANLGLLRPGTADACCSSRPGSSAIKVAVVRAARRARADRSATRPGASASRCRRVASSRSCCSSSAARQHLLDARTADLLVLAVTLSMMLGTAAADRATRPSPRAGCCRRSAPYDAIDEQRDAASSSPASAASGRSSAACCASRAFRSPPLTAARRTSTSCAASATRSITGMPRAWTCCGRRARRAPASWCSRSMIPRRPRARRCWCASSSRT